MRKFGTFDIPFTGLKLGTHDFQYEINKTFFDQFEFSEIEDAHFNVIVSLEKQSAMMILHFNLKGNVEILCDRCGDMMSLKVALKDRIIVKFGEEEVEQSEAIWVIPHHEHQINVAKLIHELAQLSLPTKRIHPEGECNESAIDYLNHLEFDDTEEITDPRWEGLKNIKKDLK